MPRRTGALHPEDIARVRIIKPLDIHTARAGKFFHGKMYVRPRTYLFEGMHGAQRVFLKRITHSSTPSLSHHDLKWDMQKAQEELKIRERLKAAGLPVPKAGVWQIKSGKNRGVYLVIASFLRGKEKKSKLRPLNPYYSEPVFLKQLDVENPHDRKLIMELAHDTATMLNHGIAASFFDFFGVYPKQNGEWGHMFMDTTDLWTTTDLASIKHTKTRLLEEFAKGSGSFLRYDFWTMQKLTRYGLFAQELEKHLRPELK